jgi:photosystem II stability/assembly factor-like uncharacterized protein
LPAAAAWLLCTALGAGPACAEDGAAASAQPPVQLPAAPSALASENLLNDSALAGKRIVAVGAYGNIIYSDGDGTWHQADKVPTQVLLTAVAFANADEGWAAGHDSIILHTADGGRNWEIVYQNPFPDGDVPKPILDLYFSDPLHGIAVGAFSLMLVTADGGKSWDSVDTGPLRDLLQAAEQETEPNFNAIIPLGDGYLIAGELGTLISYRPPPGPPGTSEPQWRVLHSPYAGSFFGARELTSHELLIYGLRGHCFRSRDGGDTWSAIETQTTANLYDALELDNGEVIVVGAGGTILRIPRDSGSAERVPYGWFNGFVSVQRIGPRRLLLFGDAGAHPLDLP